jgi:hypothetical protein
MTNNFLSSQSRAAPCVRHRSSAAAVLAGGGVHVPVRETDGAGNMAVVTGRTVHDGHCAQLSQAVAAEFIARGHFAAHIRQMRAL